jgi:histidinol-phosphate aminotransferase
MIPQPRPWLDRVDPYRPGTHAASAAGSLASNESAVGASADVAAAVGRAGATVHRYPDPLADALRDELAAQHGVHPDQILVGNGSDELIFQLAWAYLAHGGTAVCADPAYRVDEISTYVTGADVVSVPLRGWRHDLDAMAAVPAEIAYVVNPHNPTGTTVTLAEIGRFAEEARADLVVVDEAYIDFADEDGVATAIPRVATGRVAVLRTFSKIHGLAGLRVGYLVAPAEVVATLRKIRAPFSVGTLSQAGALAALRDRAHRDRVREHTLAMRRAVTELLTAAGMPPVESQANFVLVPVPDEDGVVARLADAGVAVRPGSALGVPGTVRISMPDDDGLDLLRRALATAPVVVATAGS